MEVLPAPLENHECFVTFVFEGHDRRKHRGRQQEKTKPGTEFRLGVRNGQMFVDDEPFELHPSSAQFGWDHFLKVTGDQQEHWFGYPEGPIHDVTGFSPIDEMLYGFV
jgi:hypothetical protein